MYQRKCVIIERFIMKLWLNAIDTPVLARDELEKRGEKHSTKSKMPCIQDRWWKIAWSEGWWRLIFFKLATAGNPCSYVSPTCVVLMRYTLMMGFEHRRVGMEVTWGKAVHHCFVGTTRWPTQADTLDLGILKVTKKSCLVEKSSCFPTRNQPLFVEVGRSHSL